MSARHDCPHCEGTGMVEFPYPEGERHPPRFMRCECVLREDIIANAERVMPGLVSAPIVKRSPLANAWGENVFITSSEKWFKAHLRFVALRRPPIWAGRVISDADLVTSWLASVALNGKDILDPDAYGVSTQYITLADLVVPPDLLVIRMGVKVARNVAAPEVLSETIMLRKHERRPTWIWATPEQPLSPGHLFWSDDVARCIQDFKRVGASKEETPAPPATQFDTSSLLPVSSSGKKTLR